MVCNDEILESVKRCEWEEEGSERVKPRGKRRRFCTAEGNLNHGYHEFDQTNDMSCASIPCLSNFSLKPKNSSS